MRGILTISIGVMIRIAISLVPTRRGAVVAAVVLVALAVGTGAGDGVAFVGHSGLFWMVEDGC